ncbi:MULTISPECIES: YggS family pyridoxal phosphate-dependent enzyme [unclassified Acinetobacter]|uniref:YggS family pyridoxal phosphate-dependent enzyme n=1 Tax=unclassified Acinetobacter TaxID=196816 RepID=UPI002D1EB683|nr:MULTISPECIES: YggS family pyridoxal phosphate-dependent enzyme [unclassified Acinetobacter]MEB3794082.1 YggS family pyridoxal phosphate-dependent enzyme [Acinetobacter sp. IK24]MEB3813162.1 YggS family pyridoxal phosphate-dependent enzyme [Acinetobacter sp. IK22]MEB3833305.1 YggS family pyridoxal phosphate-dependent enzyme [Acinetobacter sp. IK23]MEB3838430.1 YggS family pyridoxal phosphate-dependent enzyme [Acinetobacter sp. IK25]
MNYLQDARQHVLQQIKTACEHAQRAPETVQLLAVSKTHPSERLREMYAAGQKAFGENYLQEALDKIEALHDLDIEWHFIGHVQRNKTKHLAEKFDWVHGVDRLIIAERLSNQRGDEQTALNICLQVNIDGQDSKDGCAPEEVAELVAQISQLPKIKLRGLMVIPAPDNTAAFADAKKLFDEVKGQHVHAQDWDTLSMGMSGDLDAAIAAGSTMVRVGTALFGKRDPIEKK